jgi:hypothetical protein
VERENFRGFFLRNGSMFFRERACMSTNFVKRRKIVQISQEPGTILASDTGLTRCELHPRGIITAWLTIVLPTALSDFYLSSSIIKEHKNKTEVQCSQL